MPEPPEDSPLPIATSTPGFAPGPRWSSSVAAHSSLSLADEPSEEGFPLVVLPAVLAGYRCRRDREAPFSTACLVAYIVGGRPTCASCDVAIPRLLQAVVAARLDTALGAAIPRALATAQARAGFYR